MNELADLKKRFSNMEEALKVREAAFNNLKVTVVCILGAIKQVQEKFGVNFMRKGEFYGIKF